MAAQEGYKGLVAWKKSLQLSIKIYKVTRTFPSEERFGLTNQMRRCSISIPSNIAEGYGRYLPGSFLNYTRIALGSLNELETQTIIAEQLKYIDKEKAEMLTQEICEIRKLLYGLIKRLKFRIKNYSGS